MKDCAHRDKWEKRGSSQKALLWRVMQRCTSPSRTTRAAMPMYEDQSMHEDTAPCAYYCCNDYRVSEFDLMLFIWSYCLLLAILGCVMNRTIGRLAISSSWSMALRRLTSNSSFLLSCGGGFTCGLQALGSTTPEPCIDGRGEECGGLKKAR
jgi:hypothetical protein